MDNEYNHLTLTDLLQFVVDSIDEQDHTHLNQTKLAELVAVSTGFKFPDSEHKRAMAALDRAKKRCRHFYKAPLCRLVEVCGDDTMTFYNKDCVAEVHVILSEDEDEKDDEQAAAIRIHVPEAKKFKKHFLDRSRRQQYRITQENFDLFCALAEKVDVSPVFLAQLYLERSCYVYDRRISQG